MAFLVSKQITAHETVELRTLRYRDWPAEARSLARVVLGSQRAHAELLRQLDRKDWLVAQIERLQRDNRGIAEWLGEG